MSELLPPLDSFRFHAPWLLCAVLILPIWAWLRGRYAPVAAVEFSSKKLLDVASRHSRFWPGSLLRGARYLSLTLVIVALARPQVERGLTDQEATGINIVLVLDFSSTMKTKDFLLETRRVSRIDAMKRVVAEFIQARENDRIGIVRFDRGANLVSPLTLDHQWLLTQLAAEEAGQGTAPGSGMLIAGEALLPAKDQSKVIITVTDADQVNQGPRPEEVAQSLAPLGIKNHIIQIVDFASMQQVTASGKIFNEIARTLNGQFFKVSDVAGLRAVYRQIDQLEKAAFKERKQKTWRELMSWPAGAALAILLLELVLAQTVWRRLP